MDISFDDRVLLVRSYLSVADCDALRGWAMSNTSQFRKGRTRADVDSPVLEVDYRLSNRYSEGIVYPGLVYEVQSRVSEFLRLGSSPVAGSGNGTGGKDGVVVSITYDGGGVSFHTDNANELEGLHTLRCNVVTTPRGGDGEVWVAGVRYVPEQGDLMCYLVSKYEHGMKTWRGEPRVLFMFGFSVAATRWEGGEITSHLSGGNSA